MAKKGSKRSGGGGGSKQRKYTRDNNGRFASTGTGATARGGRLKTAAGNKRKTQTMQSSAALKGTIGKPKGLKPGTIKPKVAAKPAAAPKTSTPAERIKIKTPIRRAISANRASVITPGQRSRLETGKGARIKSARLNSTVAKPRTIGNTKPQVTSRVKRKLAAENVKMNKILRAERVGARQGKQYERSLKRQTTLEQAKNFLESGKLPGKDNSISAQRDMRQAKQRLAAKNAERRSQAAAAPKPAAHAPKQSSRRRRPTADESRAKGLTPISDIRARQAAASAASRPDTAASNIPMRGARGRALNAEISRNVNAQKAASRAASKASGRQFKSDQSRAKKLREVHLGPLAAGYAQRNGRKVADVKAAIRGMAPSDQVKLFRQYVRENRGTARAAAKPAAPKTAKPRRQVTETQLGNAAKRAKKVEISRYLLESDRMNAGGKETFAKRFAASQLREEKAKRTSRAAKAFLNNYGMPSLFGQRPVLSTKDSPGFGAKKRKRR